MKKKTSTGRNPVDDKSVQVTFWIKGSKVTALGGMYEVRNLCIDHVTKAANREIERINSLKKKNKSI